MKGSKLSPHQDPDSRLISSLNRYNRDFLSHDFVSNTFNTGSSKNLAVKQTFEVLPFSQFQCLKYYVS